jgi:hypothetical protein
MKQDEMTICECIEYLDSMVGDDENIKGCLDYIERKAKAMDKKLREYKSIFEEKQETNLDYYKDEILEDYAQNLAVVKGRPTLCYKTNCNDCDFKINQIGCREKAKDWLNKPYKNPTYKLTQFEIDLLQSCSQGYSPKYQFKNINSLTEMRKNGYFKCINRDETIEEILAKCEVV